MKVTVNMNEWVKVKLTDYGIEVLKKQHKELQRILKTNREFTPPETDDGGYVKFQLWDLFERFGSHVGLCKAKCFEFEILIEN